MGTRSDGHHRTVLAAWILTLAAAAGARAGDWPTYRHDNARSGITAERLEPPLAPCWVFRPRHAPAPAWGPPKPVPVEGYLEGRRMHFDDTYHVVAADGAVYFGSSSDHKVYCLDAGSGAVRWTALTGGPVRLAPTVWRDRLLVGSDDGHVYALRASDGGVVWKRRAAPRDDRVLGNGRMISLWPIRTGVLVDGDVAYFGAGIFPAEGVYLYAVRAEDGEVLWVNDTCGEGNRGGLSPQGYLLASARALYAPLGRVSPAVFERRSGRLLQSPFFGKRIGGTYALLAGEYLVTGTEEMIAYRKDAPQDRFAWYWGRQIIVTPETSYLLSDRELSALDRGRYPAASLRRRALLDRRLDLGRRIASARRRGSKGEIDALTKQLRSVEGSLAKVEAIMAPKWRSPCRLSDALILAGGILYAGGTGGIAAVDAATGRRLWTGDVEGRAKGLAVAGGRLYVSTDAGAIHCFGPAGSPASGERREPVDPSPYPEDARTPLYAKAAERIVEATGVRGGYALVLGCETGRLALEIARRTDLRIYAVDPDPRHVAAARRALDAAGLLGARICVERWPLSAVPYADYFADLIVSETTLLRGTLPGDPKEMLRMLKPLGGAICLGQPAGAAGRVEPLRPAAARAWLSSAGLEAGRVLEERGVWVSFVRGALPGAGSWTHQYADPGNTACGDDRIVRCPLGILWFGGPGPALMPNRHARAPAPLSIDGRLFIQGENAVMAYDAYNGRKLWERRITGAMRGGIPSEASNLAARSESLFVAIGDRCLRLDARTGRTRMAYRSPVPMGGSPARWGYVACVGDILYGSRSPQPRTSDALFALGIEDGEPRWVYRGAGIGDTTVAIDGGRVFLARSGLAGAQREKALEEGRAQLARLEGEARARDEAELRAPDLRLIVALDAKSGARLWERPIALLGPRGGTLSSIAHGGVLVLFNTYVDGHFWKDFFAGHFARRRVTALAAEDGRILWSRPVGYRVRPLVVGDTLHAEPWAFDLRTGEQRMRRHPVTGRPTPWQFARPGHHCGAPAASPNCLFFRSWTLGYYDLVRDDGTFHFGAQRPGCWINFIPANGLLLYPEASAGCMCAFPMMCTVAFTPRGVNRAWGLYAAKGPCTPVERLAINLGAPGDRRDAGGTLWLAYPRPHNHPLVLKFDLQAAFLPGGGFFHRSPDLLQVAGTDTPWLYASGGRGLSRCVIPLRGKGDPPARYTVRLAFVQLGEGKRIVTVALGGRQVLADLDVAREAGGPRRALVKTFTGIGVERDLAIELKPADPTRGIPVLAAIEIVREAAGP